MLEAFIPFLPLMLTLITVMLLLSGAHWLLIKRNPDLGNERLFPRQLIMLGLTLVSILVVVFVLPISDGLRSQLMALIGVFISGIFAFSSTTVISNLFAGILLRITKPFQVGDFIRIGEYFGRVSERGLFDTEIQTETRELISLPNTYCIKNPVTTIRRSGTIISVSLSLGYDLDHRQIEPLLIEAAQSCGLFEPFVHIMELGDYAVTYRISGLLEEPKRLISARSKLYASVLDTLHSHNVEIMSPAFMNQRKVDDNKKIIPTYTTLETAVIQDSAVEDIVFDKAEQAEQLEHEKQELQQETEKLKVILKQVTNDEEKTIKKEALKKVEESLNILNETPPKSS